MNPAARLALAPTDLPYTRATRDDGAGFSVLALVLLAVLRGSVRPSPKSGA